MDTTGIIIVGLGPGDPELLTGLARDLLQSCSELYVLTKKHPVVQFLLEEVKVISLDEGLQMSNVDEAGISPVVTQVLELGRRDQGVVFAVGGHPFVDNPVALDISRQAQLNGIMVKVVAGVSLVDCIYSALNISLDQQICVVHATKVANAHAPKFPPSVSSLVLQVSSAEIAAKVKHTLLQLYPEKHLVQLVHAAGTQQQLVEKLELSQIEMSAHLGESTALYLPPLATGTAFEDFLEIVAHLRSPEGCPWDREQTHQSLRATLLEETYEVLDALDKGDIPGLQEELGDLLLQIYLHAQVAVDEGEFSIADVLSGIYSKILRRHPHVFSQEEVEGVNGVLVNWERIKAEERAANGKQELSLLDGVTKTLPALTQSDQYLKRVARVGFDWPDLHSVLEKLQEELTEVDHASNSEEKLHEVGDLLLAVVNLARWIHVDPESALRQANLRFKERFNYIEAYAKQGGKSVSDLSLAEMESLWQEAKKLLHS